MFRRLVIGFATCGLFTSVLFAQGDESAAEKAEAAWLEWSAGLDGHKRVEMPLRRFEEGDYSTRYLDADGSAIAEDIRVMGVREMRFFGRAGRKVGPERIWYEDDALASQVMYDAGMRHGDAYYFDGKGGVVDVA